MLYMVIETFKGDDARPTAAAEAAAAMASHL